MAFLAGIGFSGHLNGKGVTGMTGGAGTQTAVQVDTADALVGPALDDGKIKFTGSIRVTGFRARNL